MSEFFTSYELWKEAVVSAVLLGAVCGLMGVYTVLRRVVFMPAALSQMAGLGVSLSFVVSFYAPSIAFPPVVGAAVVSCLSALLLGALPEPKGLSREAVIGASYVLASGGALLLGEKVPQGAHDIHDVLFGNAVIVESSQMWQAVAVAMAVLALHGLLSRAFLMIAFDRETARAQGLPVSKLNGILFLALGLLAATGTKTIGALPIFAFTLLPPMIALKLTSRMPLVFLWAALIGAFSAFTGYAVSFLYQLPTGACMAVNPLLLAIILWPIKKIARTLKHRSASETALPAEAQVSEPL